MEFLKVILISSSFLIGLTKQNFNKCLLSYKRTSKKDDIYLINMCNNNYSIWKHVNINNPKENFWIYERDSLGNLVKCSCQYQKINIK